MVGPVSVSLHAHTPATHVVSGKCQFHIWTFLSLLVFTDKWLCGRNDILSRSVLCYLYWRSCILLMVCETWCCFVLCCSLSK